MVSKRPLIHSVFAVVFISSIKFCNAIALVSKSFASTFCDAYNSEMELFTFCEKSSMPCVKSFTLVVKSFTFVVKSLTFVVTKFKSPIMFCIVNEFVSRSFVSTFCDAYKTEMELFTFCEKLSNVVFVASICVCKFAISPSRRTCTLNSVWTFAFSLVNCSANVDWFIETTPISSLKVWIRESTSSISSKSVCTFISVSNTTFLT